MKVNFDEIDIENFDIGGGAIYKYKGVPYNGIIVEFNVSGGLIGEMTIVNGSKNGKITLYYDNGQIMEEGYESNNKPYGILREWDEGGNLIKEIDFGPEHTP